MKIDNTNSQMRFNNYKDLSKYVIYVNPLQYLRMMRRRLERDRFLDGKGRPRKVYVPIAIRDVSKMIMKRDDLVGDLSKIKNLSQKDTDKNIDTLTNNQNCSNINIYINNPINNGNQSNNTVNNTNSTDNFNNANINYNMNNNMSNWPSLYWNMTGYYNMNTSRYGSLHSTHTTNEGVGSNQSSTNNSSSSSSAAPPVNNMDYSVYNQSVNMAYPNNNTVNNPINNSNHSNNTVNNTNSTDNFNNANINYNMNNDMGNWPCFYWNMTGYYNMNTSRYGSLHSTHTTNEGVGVNQSTSNTTTNNATTNAPSVNNMDYSSYKQSLNMNYPNNPYYYSNTTSDNTSSNTNNYGSANENSSKSANEEFPDLVQGSFKGYDGLMSSQGYSSTPLTGSSFFSVNSPNDMNNMYIANNFDPSSFSSTAPALTNTGSIVESHSSIPSSSGFNGPPTEREKNNTINKREEITSNYMNLNNSPFTECSIDTEVVCKTEQIYNINENGTVIDTNLGDELTIGLNEPLYFNTNLINNIDENVIGNIIDSNCVKSSCYLDTGSEETYNETHLQSILMDQNSINTTSTIINDHDLVFNTANSTTKNSINSSGSVNSPNNFETRTQEDREPVGISTRQCDSNDISYIYRQLSDYF